MNPLPKSALACLGLALCGFLVWAVFATLPALGGRGLAEAWATRAYWVAGLPALALVHALAGYAGTMPLSRLPLCALAGHGLAMLLLHKPGTDAGLLPLAILLAGVPLYGLLLAAAWLGRQVSAFRATA